MTFAKPFSGTFAYKGYIPSSVMNAIANDIPNALDKTGDTISNSTITLANAGYLIVTDSGGIVVSGGTTAGQISFTSGGVCSVFSGGVMNVYGGASVNLSGGTMEVGYNGFGGSLIIDPSARIQVSLGSFDSYLSFAPQLSTPTITQAPQTGLVTYNGQALLIQAQPGGASLSSAGGNLRLQGGTAGGHPGNVYISSGAAPFVGTVTVQPNYAYLSSTGAAYGQAGSVYREMFFANTNGTTSTQTFAPYLFSLIGPGQTFVAEVTYSCHGSPAVGGKCVAVGVSSGIATQAAIYGSQAQIVLSGTSLVVNITPPAGSLQQWQLDCYLMVN